MPETTFTLSEFDASSAWGDHLLALARRAEARVRSRTGLAPPGRILITTYPNLLALRREVGPVSGHVVAVAIPARGEVAIVRPILFSQEPEEQYRTMVHELTHLMVARHAAARLPAWLDEGLAMIVAGEGSFDQNWRLTVAGALGGLLPLARLENGMTFEGDAQSLAYAESLSVTQFLIDRTAEGERTGLPAFMNVLTDPERGAVFIGRLWDPLWRDALDAQWRNRHHALWNWVALLSGAGFLWVVASLLLLLAWWRKRRMSRMMRERFAREEALEAEFGEPVEEWSAESEAERWGRE